MNEKIIVNPITLAIKASFEKAKQRLNIAVPFISPFAREIVIGDNLPAIKNKKLLTRFDETNINSFHLPTLDYLIDIGFEIRHDNNIHLKLYLFDNDAFVTSSNLTKGGFENNIELTVQVDNANTASCSSIFDDLWAKASANEVTKSLIAKNMAKYHVLKKREKFKDKKKVTVTKTESLINIGNLDIKKLTKEIFKGVIDSSETLKRAHAANKRREEIKKKLRQGFDSTIFYEPPGHEKRRENLFYDFVYGCEVQLAGTGLREDQFSIPFRHQKFPEVVAYIYPEMHGLEAWNLSDEKSYQQFCDGLFDFKIPQYAETLPIRLASYFYPEYFLPIFKLLHLQQICEPLGLKTDAKTRGERLYAYNTFLLDKLKTVPHDNIYVKSQVAYQFLYAIELYNRLQNNERYDEIVSSYKKVWIRQNVERGREILIQIGAIT